MSKTPSNGTCKSVANSQEPGVVKEKITYKSALRGEGIDELFIARKLKDLLQAQGRQWNPKERSWDKFEDYGIQLAALREIAKILGIYTTQEVKRDSRTPTAFIIDVPRPGRPLPTTNRQQDSSGCDGRERSEH
jgi:hypothetical protein